MHQLLKFLNYTFLRGHCVLCNTASGRAFDLCRVCEDHLPRIGHHCKVCCVSLTSIAAGSGSSINIDTAPALSLCGACLKQTPAYSQTHIPYTYQPPVDHLLWRFKFSGDLAAGQVLARLLAQYIGERNIGKVDMIVPVPLHWRRQLNRGFNQARELAVTVGNILDIPVSSGVVQRTGHTHAQQGLNRRQRQSNLSNSFAINAASTQQLIKDKSIVIIDDVVTTGSTVEAIAKLLINNGAAQVKICAVARTPLEN